jgi:hypothetical protein
MQAYKTITDIENGFLHIPMPKAFEGKKVEVIVLEKWTEESILPFDTDEPAELSVTPNPFQAWLLSAPTWTDQDYDNFLTIRQAFNRWEL